MCTNAMIMVRMAHANIIQIFSCFPIIKKGTLICVWRISAAVFRLVYVSRAFLAVHCAVLRHVAF